MAEFLSCDAAILAKRAPAPGDGSQQKAWARSQAAQFEFHGDDIGPLEHATGPGCAAAGRLASEGIFMKTSSVFSPLATITIALLCANAAQAQATLSGWALMPANTFSDGPTTGQFAAQNPYGTNLLPLLNKQSVQGISAVLQGPTADTFLVMPDNGFGTQNNSADALLRMYAVRPDFKTASGGSGTISAANFNTGAPQAGFTGSSNITLSDPNNLLGIKVQADYAKYYNGSSTLNASGIAVDPSIRNGRLLTGADFDIESVRKDKNGNIWFGEEFGPYLVKTNAQGVVQRREIAMPGVFAPENVAVTNGSATANLGSSRGFEGMAINPAGDRLYTLLEGTVTGDPLKTLRINEFSVDTEKYTGKQWSYKLDDAGTNIGDMTALNDHEFLVIERNGSTATSPSTAAAPFKKIFKIDINKLDAAGNVSKTEVVDLMNIADPNDLNGDGKTSFTFPYVTIESVLILDANTLLVINDNNYPYGGGRALAADDTEFLRISLNPVPEPGTWVLMAAGLLGMAGIARRRQR
jgi:hypothetical protein